MSTDPRDNEKKHTERDEAVLGRIMSLFRQERKEHRDNLRPYGVFKVAIAAVAISEISERIAELRNEQNRTVGSGTMSLPLDDDA